MTLLTTFPTSVFTFLVAVCTIWWLLSMVLSGLDVDLDADGDAGDGLGDALGFTAMPLPLALTLLSLGGWITTALLQTMFTEDDLALGAAAAIGVLIAAVIVGLVLVKLLSKPLGRIFEVESAPSLTAAVGSVCKVRTVDVTERTGSAEVITGAARGSLISVRASDGRFSRGDLGLIVAYEESTHTFVIDDVDELVRPD